MFLISYAQTLASQLPLQASPFPTISPHAHEIGSSSQKVEPNSFNFVQDRMELLLLLRAQMFKVLYSASAPFFARRVARLISFTILLIRTFRHTYTYTYIQYIQQTLPA